MATINRFSSQVILLVLENVSVLLSVTYSTITITSFLDRTNKLIKNITYIKCVSRKKALLGKILAHICKSDNENESWSPEVLYDVLNNMISENVVEILGSESKLNPD